MKLKKSQGEHNLLLEILTSICALPMICISAMIGYSTRIEVYEYDGEE